MASRIGPRTVKDATRFTSTIPHATAKSGPSAVTALKTKPAASPRIPGETPEQRVQRLRKAHLAAQQAQISQVDRVIDRSRRVLDTLQRATVKGLVAFTFVAVLISVYSVWDMLKYNRARRAEWVEAQKAMEADSLATARVAYLKGEASPEQIILVEEANAAAEAAGQKLPPLISPPQKRTHFEESVQPVFQSEGQGMVGVVKGWFGFGGSKSETPASTTATTSPTAEATVASIGDKAKSAWESEKENQRIGGPLDQLGVKAESTSVKQKGWWPW